MGFINSAFGAQQDVQPVQNPTTPEQAAQAFANTQSGLSQQQQFINAVMGQNALGNQSDVFNQMQGTAGQLQGIANGTGPNPALAQLNQATGQNIASQASLMAGQRGASSNPGLMARLAAQQGGNIQQQAVGQGATMQAQQQIAALQGLQGQQANMANLATQQFGQQQNALQAYNQGAQNQQSNLLGGISSQNQVNQAALAQNAKNNAKLAGMGIGSAGSLLSAAHGGQVPIPPVEHYRTEGQHTAGQYADGGSVQVLNGPQSFAGQYLRGNVGSGNYSPDTSSGYEDKDMGKGSQGITDKLSKMFGAAPGASSTGVGAGTGAGAGMSAGLGAEAGMGAATGAEAAGIGSMVAEAAPLAAALARGGAIMGKDGIDKVPGNANVGGDSLKNDTVPAILSPGEIVIPRSHSQDPDKAAAFARAVVMKNRKGRK